MKSLTSTVLHFLIAATLCFFSVASLAIPKAAEHEDAPVTTGANVARPKHSTTPANQQASGKNKKATIGKPAKSGRSTKKSAAVTGKK